MKFKSNLIVAALALAAAGAANAELTPGTAAPGSGSVVFVAMDTALNQTTLDPNISMTIDLGYLLADYLPQVPTLSYANGSLSGAGTTVVWDFKNNTRTTNGTTDSGTFSWSAAYNSFVNTVNGIAGDTFQWGVIGADKLSGAASATNLVQNQNLLATIPSSSTGITSANISTGGTNLADLLLQSNGTGTHTPGVTGANTATAGGTFLATILDDNFGGQLAGGSYFNNTGTQAEFSWLHQAAQSTVTQVGSFSFDALNGTLTYTVAPVPEPGAISMALAGLGALGFVARRRRKH